MGSNTEAKGTKRDEQKDTGKENEKDEKEDGENMKLKKVELLPIFVKEPKSIKVTIEKEAFFETTVKSTTKVDVIWYINGKETLRGEGIKIEKDLNKNIFSMTIKRVSKAQEGELRCRAINEHGFCETTKILTIYLVLPQLL